MSVLIAVPTYETISTETYKALWELDDCGHEVWFDAVKGYDCALARIKCCEKALELGAEWLWMVDSDTVPPPDALANLVSWDEDFVLGYYQWKNRPAGETCIWKAGGWFDRYTARELHALDASGTQLVEVHGGGMGCALVRTAMLDRLKRPWFRWDVTPDGIETGEDIYFANACHDARVPVYCDTRVACGHVYRSEHDV